MSDSSRSTLHFRIGEAFPAKRGLAQFVAALSMALDDYLLVGNVIRQPGHEAHERLYYFKLASSNAWETAEFIKESCKRHRNLRKFVRTLPPDVADHWAQVEKALDAPDGFGSLLSELRNGFFHYPRVQGKGQALERALLAAADDEGRIRAGTKVGDVRLDFAAEISYRLALGRWGPPGGPNQEAEEYRVLAELMERVLDLLDHLREFSFGAIHAYLARLPKGVLRETND